MRPATLLLFVFVAGIPAALPARAFGQEGAFRGLFEEPLRPVSAGPFGFSWSIELRACDRPKATVWGLGFDGIVRVHDRLWFDFGASYLIGESATTHVNYGRNDNSPNFSRQIHGFEARAWVQYRFAQWRSNSSYLMGGPTLGYFDSYNEPQSSAQATVALGPSAFIGIEFGRRVRAAFDGGVTIPVALNRGDAGWMETHIDSGAIGLQWTIIRISLRWYAHGR